MENILTGYLNNKTNKQILSVSKIPQEQESPADANFQALQNIKLNPWFVTGFTDAEGSFSTVVAKSNNLKVNWQARLFFQISLHVKDRILLEQIKDFFCVGEIYTKTSDSIIYTVKSMRDLAVIIDHFEKYPLITQKRADYEVWKQVFIIIKNREHLTLEGLKKIVSLKSIMNWGISNTLETAFTGLVPVQKYLVKSQVIQDPNWLAGFVSGEGCFHVDIFRNKASKLGVAIKLVFKLSQHSKEVELMKSLKDYFGCGNIYKYGEAFEYRVSKISDIQEKIIPFFKNYLILGVKSEDFADFCLALDIVKLKNLTEEKLDKLKIIKSGMNKGRKK